MSISSMTNAAIARRPDFHPLNAVPEGLEGIARAIAGPPPAPPGATPKPPSEGPPPSNGATNALQVIAAYIPTEVLTLYVAFIAALHKEQAVTRGEWTTFWCFLAATPIVVWVVYATKVRAAGRSLPLRPQQWPVWEMCAATIAYVAWAYALPGTPFLQFEQAGYYSSSIAGLVVLVVSTVLGLLAPLFQRPLTP